jgi:type II secretory pathway pseudopilin PulG
MRRRQDEDGAALIGALIFVIVCSIVVAAILGFADTGFRTTIAVREQRQEAYAADAAMEAAIRDYQQNGRRCPSAAQPFSAPGTNGFASGAVTVTCSADGGNAPGPPGAPMYSIMTRGSAPGDGIRAVSGALTPARGGVFAEGSIDVTSGARLYVVGGTVTAKGTCNGTIEVTPAATCNYAGAAPLDPAGIASAPAVPASAPALRSAPPCPAGGAPVVFQQGRYIDLAALKALTNSCGSTTFHFAPNADGTPGIFHFDFVGGGAWTVGNGETFVGGTLLGPLSSIAAAAVGRKCDGAQQGVQFVFSGESRLGLGSGAVVELCPPLFADPTVQRVSLYGPALGAGAPVTVGGLVPVTATSGGNPKFDPVDEARVADDTAAIADVDEKKSADLTVGGFVLPAVPVGSTVGQVSVTVRHKETATTLAPVSLSAVVSGGTGSTSASTTISTFTKSTAFVSETFDVSGTFDTAAKLAGLAVKLTATNPNGGPSDYFQHIDGVSVSLTYTPPAVAAVFPPQSGCAASGASCPLVSTQGNAVLAVKGTIYAPLGMLDIQLIGSTYQVFGRGVIVRRLDTTMTSSIDCNLATIPDTEEYDACFAFQLPRDATQGDNAVFTARLNGRVLVRAFVAFGGATPVVRSWSSVNEP